MSCWPRVIRLSLQLLKINHHPSQMVVGPQCTQRGISRGADQTQSEIAFTPNEEQTVQRLLDGVCAGSRSCLAESITLVESSHRIKRAMGQELICRLQQYSIPSVNEGPTSFRIGLSGPPGAGKSTFIEALGNYLVDEKLKKLAVLAVDPSSSTRGGSILGDKTRMTMLSRNSNVYIRPSPASGHLGGVTRSTNEAILLCEAAGYEIIFIETVGVGQSEHTVSNMVDMFLLLIPPASGDELQGLKRGIMELSDLIVVNKADGDLLPAARRVAYEYISALKYIQPHLKSWKTQVTQVSSHTKNGIPEVWEVIQKFHQTIIETGELETRRQEQLKKWLWNYVSDNILFSFQNHPFVKENYKKYEDEVINRIITPGCAADELLNYFFK